MWLIKACGMVLLAKLSIKLLLIYSCMLFFGPKFGNFSVYVRYCVSRFELFFPQFFTWHKALKGKWRLGVFGCLFLLLGTTHWSCEVFFFPLL